MEKNIFSTNSSWKAPVKRCSFDLPPSCQMQWLGYMGNLSNLILLLGTLWCVNDIPPCLWRETKVWHALDSVKETKHIILSWKSRQAPLLSQKRDFWIVFFISFHFFFNEWVKWERASVRFLTLAAIKKKKSVQIMNMSQVTKSLACFSLKRRRWCTSMIWWRRIH